MKKIKMTLTIKIPLEQLSESERREYPAAIEEIRTKLSTKAKAIGREMEAEFVVDE